MSNPSIYQFRIQLYDIEPTIWRQFQVPSNISFQALHEVIQHVMGWGNLHLFEFIVGERGFMNRSIAYRYSGEVAGDIQIDEVLTTIGFSFPYTYDLGDGWEHRITLEQIIPTNELPSHPICLSGERACPPEDVGGIWGYWDLLDILADPSNLSHAENVEWLGRPYDADLFSLDAVNQALAQHNIATPVV